MSENEEMHAWFSVKQYNIKVGIKENNDTRLSLTNIYITQEGNEVEVTMVSRTKNHRTTFDDIKYLGVVSKWVRSGPGV